MSETLYRLNPLNWRKTPNGWTASTCYGHFFLERGADGDLHLELIVRTGTIDALGAVEGEEAGKAIAWRRHVEFLSDDMAPADTGRKQP